MPERNELSGLKLGEFSICFADLGGPANEDCTIEFMKSKSGLRPVLKETDMSENTEVNEGAGDADIQEFANGVIEEFNGLSEEDQVEALVGMALENAELEAAVEDATEVVKSLTENTVSKAKYDELKKSASAAVTLIEKMKKDGNVAAAADGGVVSELRKSLTEAAGGALSPDADARLTEVEKSLAATARTEAITKAKAYGFGKAEDVADLESGIRKALGDKAADTYVAQIKQAAGIAKASPAFRTLGEDAGNTDANDPIAKAKPGIEAIMKANPTLSYAVAQSQYWANNPAEYRALRESEARNAA